MKTFQITRLFTLLCLMCISSVVFAQKNIEDVIYLKTGNIIRGKILEYTPDEKTRIETYARNIWVFSSEEIEKIVKEPIPEMYLRNVNKEGFNTSLSINIMGGTDDGGTRYNLGLRMINGYQFQKKAFAGIGLGIEFWDMTVMPFFVDLRYNLLDGKASPMFYFQGGHSFSLENSSGDDEFETTQKGGPMLGAGIGLSRMMGKTGVLQFSVGYRYQQTRINERSWWSSRFETEFNYNRIEVSLGILFQ